MRKFTSISLNSISSQYEHDADNYPISTYSDLSSRLGLSPVEGERWIVELVRDARLDAKIDLQKNIVTMNVPV